jgi:hypothetical protein
MLPADAGRLLAFGELDQPVGGLAAATTHLLAWQQDCVDGLETIWVPWDQVLTAAWSQGTLDLVVAGPAGDSRNLRLRLADPGAIPQVVRERISWTVVVSHPVTLRNGLDRPRAVVLTARRSTRDGVICWHAVFDPSAGPITGPQAGAAARALQEMADKLGIGTLG